MQYSLIFVSTLLSLLLAVTSQAGTLYKWVDEDGRVHYSDKLPPVDTQRAHSQLNEQGVTVDSVGAAKTAEQIRQEQEVERLRRERQRVIDKQKAEDRVLLSTFRSEDDIIMTRDGQLQAVDASITVTQANIRRLKLKLQEMQQQAAELELSGQRISARFQQEIETKRTALEDSYQSIVNREHDKDRIRKSFAKDLQRFRELKQLEAGNDPFQEATESLVEALKNVYDCGDDRICDTQWIRARDYLRGFHTTPITMDADNILMSRRPLENEDISFTLSRIHDNQRDRTIIFLDLQCRNSLQGNNLCKSNRVRNIEEGFQAALIAATQE